MASIGRGFLVLLGVTASDTERDAAAMVCKIAKLRVFPDEQGKSNLSVTDIGGELLVVSQFTLYADTRGGNRPSFTNAAPPEHANAIYEHFVTHARAKFRKVETGRFGAKMDVRLANDGPFTIILEMPQEAV